MANIPAVLILDDGELDDVQTILEELEVEFGRVRGGAIAPNTPHPKSLLMATPRRISAVSSICEAPDGEDPQVRVVVAPPRPVEQRGERGAGDAACEGNRRGDT